MNRQLETLKLQAKIQNWKINKVLKNEKEKRKGLNSQIQEFDSI